MFSTEYEEIARNLKPCRFLPHITRATHTKILPTPLTNPRYPCDLRYLADLKFLKILEIMTEILVSS